MIRAPQDHRHAKSVDDAFKKPFVDLLMIYLKKEKKKKKVYLEKNYNDIRKEMMNKDIDTIKELVEKKGATEEQIDKADQEGWDSWGDLQSDYWAGE
jgi:hypothetical protein